MICQIDVCRIDAEIENVTPSIRHAKTVAISIIDFDIDSA